MTPWLILAAVITAGGLAAWSAQRGFRTCVCCKPRRRFRTGADDINSDNPLDKQRSACVTFVVWLISGLTPWRATA